MTVFNLGSINIDLVYTVKSFPGAGETLRATNFQRLPGGKGANQSLALAAAGAEVVHIGAIHRRDEWLGRNLADAGVDIGAVQKSETSTGHAVVMVNAAGENQIVLHPGANAEIDMSLATEAISKAGARDWALLQNETNGGAEFVAAARKAGMNVAYSAAPFDAEITLDLLPRVDLLIVNDGEAAALMKATGLKAAELGVEHLVITRGGDGAEYHGPEGPLRSPAFPVIAVDTTGAGDCFTGYFLATVASGGGIAEALHRASAAGALQVTRLGAAGAIPAAGDVTALMGTMGAGKGES